MGQGIIAACLFLVTLVTYKNPKFILVCAIVALPWNGLDVDVGLRITAYLIFIAPLLVIVGIPGLFKEHFRRLKISSWTITIIVFYAILITIVMVPFLPELNLSGGVARQPALRSFTQIFMFFVSLAPLLLCPILIRSENDIKLCSKAYLASCLVLTLLGWVQLLIWYVTGSDPFPIGYFDQLLGGAAEIRSGAFDYSYFNIYRMSSFGGEPKNLSAGLFVALLLLQSGMRIGGRLKTSLWVLFFSSMLLTFSTMGIGLWVCGSLIQLFLSEQPKLKFQMTKKVTKHILVTFVICILVYIFSYLLGVDNIIIDLINLRTVSRLSDGDTGDSILEDFNIAILNFLISDPVYIIFGVGLGNAHLFSAPFIPEFARFYMEDSVYVAKSFLIKWISELGIITFVIFIFFCFKVLIKSAKYQVNFLCLNKANILIKFGTPLLLCTLLSNYLTSYLIMFIGIAISIIRINKFSQTKKYIFLEKI